jgi:hypothetical protein
MPRDGKFSDYTQEDWQRRRREVLHDYSAGLGLSTEARRKLVGDAECIAGPSNEFSRSATSVGRLSARPAVGEPGASLDPSSYLKLE